jgi:hypothetical protein
LFVALAIAAAAFAILPCGFTFAFLNSIAGPPRLVQVNGPD